MKRTAIVLAVFLLGAKVGEYGEQQIQGARESAAVDAEIESFRAELRAIERPALICGPSMASAAEALPSLP